MGRRIKGYVVQVALKEIIEVEFEEKLDSYYTLIGCNLITAPSYDENHDIIVDDEGLLKHPIEGFFEITNGEFSNEYAGNGILVGVDKNGNWTSPSISLEEFKKHVHFIGYAQVGEIVVKIVKL